MKALRTTTAVALALTVLLSLGVLTAAAQGPSGSTNSTVAYLDNQSHTIAANTSQLFRFDYAINSDASRPTTTIRLVNGTNSGVNFAVFTADELANMTADGASASTFTSSDNPVGRGTSQTINCDTGALDGSGACQSPDLTWTGTFGSSGAYYVQIVNSNASQSKYQLMITGSGVALAPQTQTASASTNPAPVPAAAPPLAATISDPSKAIAIDGQPHALAAGSQTWYKFDYAINADASRPTTTIRLVNGTNSGVGFEVWTADELANMTADGATASTFTSSDRPVGMGTAPHVNCDTGALDGSAACQAADLVWSGTFGTSGTYFVHIVNSNSSQSNYQLSITTQ